MSEQYDSVINRNQHYSKANNSLRVPLSQDTAPSSSSSLPSNRPFFSDKNSANSSSSTLPSLSLPSDNNNSVPTPYHNNSEAIQTPQQVNWTHNTFSPFYAIAHNEPIDPNVVSVPKHPNYLSKLYRPNQKEIASAEAFSTIRVETIALCCLFIVLATVFTVDYWAIILLCTLACILCFVGFLGALRNKKILIYIYWIGFAVWLVLVIIIAFAVLLASSQIQKAAVERCESDKIYVQKFNMTANGQIDCVVNIHRCLQECIKEVEQHLTLSYFLLGGIVLIFFLIYFLRGQQLLKQLIFKDKFKPEDEESTTRSEFSDDSDDSEPEEYNSNGLQQHLQQPPQPPQQTQLARNTSTQFSPQSQPINAPGNQFAPIAEQSQSP